MKMIFINLRVLTLTTVLLWLTVCGRIVPSTCTTSAPAAAAASDAAPECPKRERTLPPRGAVRASHRHWSTCSMKIPSWPDGAGRTSSTSVAGPSGTSTCHGSGSDPAKSHVPPGAARPGQTPPNQMPATATIRARS